jgi:hypothetical protein
VDVCWLAALRWGRRANAAQRAASGTGHAGAMLLQARLLPRKTRQHHATALDIIRLLA